MVALLVYGKDEEERKKQHWFIDQCREAWLAAAPELELRIYPQTGNPKEIEFILAMMPPPGLFKLFPNLKVVASLAAGVDKFLKDPDFPEGVKLTRLKDPHMAKDIAHYVLANVLYYAKRLDVWNENQQQKIWFKEPPFQLTDKPVGVMGAGYLGLYSLNFLEKVNLPVHAWSNSIKNLENIEHFAGKSAYSNFLSKSYFLVCLLPLTPETTNILNKKTFEQLPKGAVLIHLGRGEQLVEDDLLEALDSAQLAGACIDVFRQEPLPSDHPFWSHPKIRVTPHIASVTEPATAIPQILENYRRFLKQHPLLNEVNKSKGY